MSRLVWALRVLLSHWRRNPVQLGAMLAGLAVATALWSGVQAINAEARTSYDRAARLLGADRLDALIPRTGETMDIAAFVALRRAGVDVSPVLEGRLRTPDGSLRILGIEPVSMPADAQPAGLGAGERDMVAFLTPPGVGIVGAETAERFAGLAGLPPLETDTRLVEGVLIADIGVAERLLDRPGRVSRLLLAPGTPVGADVLAAHDLLRQRPEETGDLARLTDSFHLNLTAFGFLAFVVGLFIVHAATGLATEQRLGTFRTLRASGLSARALAGVLLAETLGIALLAGLLGVLLGWIIAGALLPGVALSLSGLYGATVPQSLTLEPLWWLTGIAMSLGGALLATGHTLVRIYTLPPLAAARPEAWAGAEARSVRWMGRAGLAAWAVALLALVSGNSLTAGFVVMGGVLLGAALVLPWVLTGLLRIGARTAESPLAVWAWADMRQQSGAHSLALMALLLALSANIGVGTMVEGFRTTFLGWLDQRLAAEAYVRGADEAQARAIDAFAAARPEVTAVLPVRIHDLTQDGWPVTVRGVTDDPTYRDLWPVIETVPGAWDRLFAGAGALISEQLALRSALRIGDPLPFAPDLSVLGIYPDYGNPSGQALVALDWLTARFPGAERQGTGLRLDPAAVPGFLAALDEAFDLRADQSIDQRALKRLSREIFEQTFAVTAALNVLTLAVAGLALFTGHLALADRRLPQLAPVWALGVTRSALARGEMIRTLGLAFLTALVAVPLGMVVAWLLVAVINVQAFGWRLPLHVFPGQWLRLIVIALGVAALAAAWPAFRLRRVQPARLLRVFADAR